MTRYWYTFVAVSARQKLASLGEYTQKTFVVVYLPPYRMHVLSSECKPGSPTREEASVPRYTGGSWLVEGVLLKKRFWPLQKTTETARTRPASLCRDLFLHILQSL